MYVGERIKKLRKARRMSQQELADIVGITQPTLSALENNPEMSTTFLENFALALDTTVEYLKSGAHGALSEHTTIIPEGMHMVPFYKEVELSAGNGGCIIEESTQQGILYPDSFFYRHDATYDDLICFVITGDSMEPRFENGGVVTIHTNKKKIVDGSVYAVNYLDHLYFKKLNSLSPDTVLLTSENPIYEPIKANINDLHIIGKVINYSKDL